MKRKILIVDDEADTRRLYTELFESEGYDVRCASTGEEALSTIDGYQPDVILLDIMLPGRSGIEVARELAARGNKIPTVGITASAGYCPGDWSEAQATGIRRFLFKPCRPKTLLQVVEDALRGEL